MSLHDRIKEARVKQGLTQAELGNLIGVAKTTIAGYEKNHEPTVAQFGLLAKVLKVNVSFLLQDEIQEHHENNATPDEMERIVKKYRALDGHGKKMVDYTIEEETNRMQAALSQRGAEDVEIIQFSVTEYEDPMSAGTGQPAGYGYGSNLLLTKEPPAGTSYVAPIAGDSMEPTYHNGDRLFIQACYEINVGEIGVFFMDGQQWVKELGEGVLISHNPEYEPRPMTEDIRCQGRVLGVCDESYIG